MTKIKISPKKLSGEVIVPPSKSMAHRAVICAALADGVSTIGNIDLSDDIIATMEAMKSLGAKIEQKDDKSFIIDGRGVFKENSNEMKTIDCNESGSTLRFLVPISIAKQNKM